MLERQLKAPVRHQPRVAIIDLHGEIDAEVRSNSQTGRKTWSGCPGEVDGQAGPALR